MCFWRLHNTLQCVQKESCCFNHFTTRCLQHDQQLWHNSCTCVWSSILTHAMTHWYVSHTTQCSYPFAFWKDDKADSNSSDSPLFTAPLHWIRKTHWYVWHHSVRMTVSAENTPPKSTKAKSSNSSVQIQIKPKSHLEFVPRDSEEFEFFDLVDFGGVVCSVETVIPISFWKNDNVDLDSSYSPLSNSPLHWFRIT